MYTGTDIKRLRKSLDLSQQELAELIRVTVSTVYKWEQILASKPVPYKYWELLKDVLDNKNAFKRTALIQELNKLIGMATPSELKKTIQFMEGLLSEKNSAQSKCS